MPTKFPTKLAIKAEIPLPRGAIKLALVRRQTAGKLSALGYESGHSSEICGRGNPMRLWQRDQDPLHAGDDFDRYLQRLPSVLHRPAEVCGYRRPRGQIPAAPREDPGRPGCRRRRRCYEKEEEVAA